MIAIVFKCVRGVACWLGLAPALKTCTRLRAGLGQHHGLVSPLEIIHGATDLPQRGLKGHV